MQDFVNNPQDQQDDQSIELLGKYGSGRPVRKPGARSGQQDDQHRSASQHRTDQQQTGQGPDPGEGVEAGTPGGPNRARDSTALLPDRSEALAPRSFSWWG